MCVCILLDFPPNPLLPPKERPRAEKVIEGNDSSPPSLVPLVIVPLKPVVYRRGENDD